MNHMEQLVRRARDYLNANAAESGADILIDDLATELGSAEAQLDYAYAIIRSGFEFGSFDFSVLLDRAKMWKRSALTSALRGPTE